MAETLADNSENSTTIPDNSPTLPEDAQTTPDAPQAEEAPAPEEERPKTRGRPRGSKDGKPRIRRVPMVIEQEEEPAAPAAPAATKKVQFTEQAVTEEPPEPPQKSPRTLHREHVQALSAERRALAQAKQAHYESLFDRNLSW